MRKSLQFLAVAFLFSIITACSAEPSNDVLVWAIRQKHPSIDETLVKMKSYKITNHYNKEIKDEKVYFYDYTVTGTSKLFIGEQSESGTFAVVKRGEKWYMYR